MPVTPGEPASALAACFDATHAAMRPLAERHLPDRTVLRDFADGATLLDAAA